MRRPTLLAGRPPASDLALTRAGAGRGAGPGATPDGCASDYWRILSRAVGTLVPTKPAVPFRTALTMIGVCAHGVA